MRTAIRLMVLLRTGTGLGPFSLALPDRSLLKSESSMAPERRRITRSFWPFRL